MIDIRQHPYIPEAINAALNTNGSAEITLDGNLIRVVANGPEPKVVLSLIWDGDEHGQTSSV